MLSPYPVKVSIPEPHQGHAIGLPAEGPGAVASLGRRFVAILIDWALCQLIAIGAFGMQWGQVSGASSFVPLGIFFLENLLLVTTLGTTVGHRIMGVKVVTVGSGGADGQPPGPARSALRALLLCLVIPPIVMDANLRGLHDKAARTVVVKAR